MSFCVFGCALALTNALLQLQLWGSKIMSTLLFFWSMQGIGIRSLVELNENDQLNKISSTPATAEVESASSWLTAECRLAKAQTHLQVSMQFTCLDRPSKAATRQFCYVSQQTLLSHLKFELNTINRWSDVGRVWQWLGCIPMARFSSVQCTAYAIQYMMQIPAAC